MGIIVKFFKIRYLVRFGSVTTKRTRIISSCRIFYKSAEQILFQIIFGICMLENLLIMMEKYFIDVFSLWILVGAGKL